MAIATLIHYRQEQAFITVLLNLTIEKAQGEAAILIFIQLGFLVGDCTLIGAPSFNEFITLATLASYHDTLIRVFIKLVVVGECPAIPQRTVIARLTVIFPA